MTEEKMLENKMCFLSIARREISRNGLEDFLTWLKSTDFFNAPASTKFHGNYEGGLCEHSLNVYMQLVELNDRYGLEIEREALAVCGLFHDVCKADMYVRVPRNVKNADGKWVIKYVWEVDEEIPLGHGEKSCILIQRYMPLATDELLAIRWHMGGFDSASRGGDWSMSRAQEKVKLVTLLQVADMLSSHLLEKTEK